MRMSVSKYLTIVASVALMTACARSDDAAGDTARTTDSAAGAAASSATTPPTTDGDQAFLRNMVNHHEGLIQMAMAAMNKASKSTTQGDAHMLHTKQSDEQKKMIADIKTMSGETVTPTVMPQHKAMNDSLQKLSGVEYDRTFYRMVIDHHREGVQMTDAALPSLSKPEVKQMAQKMKADQQKEIAEFEKKAAAIR